MNPKTLTAFSLLFVCGLSAVSNAQVPSQLSLDANLVKLKKARSLTSLCMQRPEIIECKEAIGEWKPDQLERLKLEVPICFDKCMLDVFGFYKDPQTLREIPAVRTKDFDASAPSRGFEATFYPVAMRLFRYEGCAGCSLVYQYPTKVVAMIGGRYFNLPILGRGGFYLTSNFRKAILNNPKADLALQATTSEGRFKVNISTKTVEEYIKMLKLLRYNKVEVI
tara:strand:+ start:176 stop:844 length:669 start_codon:yes stop_codon:yes gene_type:complete